MPRITNEEIAELRNFHAFEYETDNDSRHILFSNKTVSALDRLAELEAEKHERRWRKISEEGLPVEDGHYLFTDGRRMDEIPINTNTRREEFANSFIQRYYSHWCQLRTDLPPVMEKDLPTIGEMIGCMKLPDGVTGDQYVRHLRDGGTDLPEGE